MSDKIDTILARVAAETLEKLAFVFAYPDEPPRMGGGPEGCRPCNPDGSQASVGFRGPFRGELVMDICSADLLEVAANMLGLEPGDPIGSEERQDALKEVLNVVCGNLLPAIAGKTAVFDIDAPVIVGNGGTGHPNAGPLPCGAAKLSLEGGSCYLYLMIEGRTAAQMSQMAAAAGADMDGIS